MPRSFLSAPALQNARILAHNAAQNQDAIHEDSTRSQKPSHQPDGPEHPTIMLGVDTSPIVGRREREKGMGIVERQLPLCVHRSARCARPLKLEYDVQGVDDTLGDVLVHRL